MAGPLILGSSLYAAEALHLSGEVLIQNNGPRTVVAYVQPNGGGVSHVFRVSAEEPFPQNPVSFHFEQAAVIAGAGRITVLDGAGRIAIVLAVAGLPEDRPVRESPRIAERGTSSMDRLARRNVTILRGYEVGSRTVPPGYLIAAVQRSPETAAQFCTASIFGDECTAADGNAQTNSPPGGGICNSGGHGSTQCSATNGSHECSVTCAAGYYACCKYEGPTCSCVKDL
jgi:hypothetical protein